MALDEDGFLIEPVEYMSYEWVYERKEGFETVLRQFLSDYHSLMEADQRAISVSFKNIRKAIKLHDAPEIPTQHCRRPFIVVSGVRFKTPNRRSVLPEAAPGIQTILESCGAALRSAIDAEPSIVNDERRWGGRTVGIAFAGLPQGFPKDEFELVVVQEPEVVFCRIRAFARIWFWDVFDADDVDALKKRLAKREALEEYGRASEEHREAVRNSNRRQLLAWVDTVPDNTGES